MKNLTKLLVMSVMAIGLAACGTAQNPTTGYYNSSGQWVAGVNPAAMNGSSCITTIGQPLSLSFTATGIDLVQGRFFAGNIPQIPYAAAPGAHGSVSLAAGGYQQTYSTVTLNKTSSGGDIRMTLDPNSRTAYGTIQISSTALANAGVMNSVMYGQQYGQQYGQVNSSVCVTSIALDVTYSTSGSYNGMPAQGQLFGANVYLYLSNGQVAQSPVGI